MDTIDPGATGQRPLGGRNAAPSVGHNRDPPMRVLNYEEAAGRMGIVRRSLERLIANGEGPNVVFLSQRRRGILEADFEEWLLSRRRPAR